MMPHLSEEDNNVLLDTVVHLNDTNTRKVHPSPYIIEPAISLYSLLNIL